MNFAWLIIRNRVWTSDRLQNHGVGACRRPHTTSLLNAEFRGASGEPLQDGYLSSNCSQHPGLSQRQLQTGGSQLVTYLGRLEREYAPCSYSRSGKFGRTKLTYFSVEGEKCAGAHIDNQRGRHSLGHHWRHSTIGDPFQTGSCGEKFSNGPGHAMDAVQCEAWFTAILMLSVFARHAINRFIL